MTAALLPNGKQQFIDINGAPLVAGTVGMYIPSTLTLKNTWQDSGQTILNTNPIVLDSRGQALIYGSGSYRQIVRDQFGNLIWDQLCSNSGDMNSLVAANITTTDSPYLISTADIIYVDASGGPVGIRLPNAETVQSVFIVRTDNVPANNVTLVPIIGGQTINGTSSVVMQFQHQGVTINSNGGTKWEYFGQSRPTTNPLTPGYKSWTNIFDIINDPFVVESIQSNGHALNVDAYVATAIALGGEIYFPAGSYFFAATITMLPGVVFRGAGQGNTIFFIGGATVSDWGMEMLNPNGTDQIEGFKLYDITFNLSSNGIRWNSISGGFTNDNTSQDYMLRAASIRCNILNDVARPNSIIGVQWNKCFDSDCEDCDFEGMGTGIDVEGTDISRITHTRFNACSAVAILIQSHPTFGFGSQTRCEHNDILSPGQSGTSSASALITSDLDGYFCENYIEGFATVDNAIQVTGGYNHKIDDNRIQWGTATNVLNVRSTASAAQQLYGLSFCNNHTTGVMGEIVWESGYGYYWTNSDNRCYLRVSDNTIRNVFVPMLSQQDDATPTDYFAATFTAGRKGVSFTGIANNLVCLGGDFALAANSDVSQYLELSDYSSYPASALPGTFSITARTYAGTAAGILSWQVLDGSSSVATGTITHTNANQIYSTGLVSAQAFTTKPVIRFWNADTGTGSVISVRSCIIQFG